MLYRFVVICVIVLPLSAQSSPGEGQSMPGMAMDSRGRQATTETVADFLMRQASGVSANPAAAPMPMLMQQQGDWMLMLHGNAFLVQSIENGPHGGDKLFSTNWLMGSAQRPLYGGVLQLRTMLSLEPLTIGEKGYPEPFQTGEGLVDRQHAHDLFMEFAAEWALDVGHDTTGYVYAAPVGDPALGPVAFPHRASASEIPQAALAHHLEDSTHIAGSVVTFGAQRGEFGLAFSGFHGREPDNSNRWDIDRGPIDSWALRGTWEPTANIAAQVSSGHLHDPEAAEPGDVHRTTASVEYATGAMASSAIVGWNHRSGNDSAGLTLESMMLFNASNYVTGRLEIVKKEELAHTVKALTAGYTKDLYRAASIVAGAGANVTASWSGSDRPISVFAFVRVRNRPSTGMKMPMQMKMP